MFKPSVIALDFETALTDGTPSVDYYRPDFRAISAAFAWRDQHGTVKTAYCDSEADILGFIRRVIDQHIRLVVHNYQFEYGVLDSRFPGTSHCVAWDTARLVQVADNGGRNAFVTVAAQDDGEVAETKPITSGLGLVAAASRWLPEELKSHKEPYHEYLRAKGVRKGHEGANLTLLPPEMLESYNVADAITTLHLYERLTAEFEAIGYDYKLDHELYMSTARMVAKAKAVGARVDVKALEAYAAAIEAEVAEIEQKFRERFKSEIDKLEAAAHVTRANEVKTEKARARRLAEPRALFNIGSNKQLALLFIDTLGITPKFWTKAPMLKPGVTRVKEFVPQPSFKAAHMGTYGEGGELLVKRRKRLLVLQQTRALLALAALDGRWHPDIRACGTATGRMAGGGT